MLRRAKGPVGALTTTAIFLASISSAAATSCASDLDFDAPDLIKAIIKCLREMETDKLKQISTLQEELSAYKAENDLITTSLKKSVEEQGTLKVASQLFGNYYASDETPIGASANEWPICLISGVQGTNLTCLLRIEAGDWKVKVAGSNYCQVTCFKFTH